jgi:hypothetical protein
MQRNHGGWAISEREQGVGNVSFILKSSSVPQLDKKTKWLLRSAFFFKYSLFFHKYLLSGGEPVSVRNVYLFFWNNKALLKSVYFSTSPLFSTCAVQSETNFFMLSAWPDTQILLTQISHGSGKKWSVYWNTTYHVRSIPTRLYRQYHTCTDSPINGLGV